MHPGKKSGLIAMKESIYRDKSVHPLPVINKLRANYKDISN